MTFKIAHTNLNVMDLNKSLTFYKEALNLQEVRRIQPEDESFKIVFLSDGVSDTQIERTWLADRTEPYDLEDSEIHIAFEVADFDAARKKHGEMGCIVFENEAMGLYFIEDPDGHWLEILPQK